MIGRSSHSSSHVRYSLNSLKGAIQGNILGSIIGVTKGDTMSLDCVSCISSFYARSRTGVAGRSHNLNSLKVVGIEFRLWLT